MFKGFFFNALLENGEYDRKYNADDYSNALSFVVGNGIIKLGDGSSVQVVGTNDGDIQPKLTANAASYGVKIKIGYGWINGKSFSNDTEFDGEVKMYDSSDTESSIALSSIPMAQKFYKRIDRIVVRRDDSLNVRDILPIVLKGDEVSSGTPRPLDIDFANNGGNDLCIAEILVDNTGDIPVVTITDTRLNPNLCGVVNGYFGNNWEEYCATITKVINKFISDTKETADNFITDKTTEFNDWFQEARDDVATVTMIKKITQTYTVGTTGVTFPINIAEYNPEVDNLYVYTNGIFENESDYTINSDKTITFNTSTKQAGTVIDFVVEKPIDARFYDNPDETMIESVESRFTDIYERLEKKELNEVNYVCTGTDDNIAISNMVKTFLNANLVDNARLKINVRGNFGATQPYLAQDTSKDSYNGYARWFDFSIDNATNRRFVINFECCSPVNITFADDTSNVIFWGANQEIQKCVLKAGEVANTGTRILGTFGRGNVYHKNCKYSFISDKGSCLTRHGKFDDCEVTLLTKNGHSVAFYTDPIGSICEVNRGIYWLYVGKDTTSETKFVYYNRGASFTTETPNYSQVTIVRDVIIPNLANTGDYFVTGGQSFKQDGSVFHSITNGKGYIRANNIITQRSNNIAGDSGTDSIIEGTIALNRPFGQQPYV